MHWGVHCSHRHLKQPIAFAEPRPHISRTMHDALQNADILHEILGHIIPPSEWSPKSGDVRRKMLHSAALTCKAFSEPALKQLWARIPDFHCLLGLLPSSARIISDGGAPLPAPGGDAGKGVVWTIDSPITEAERERFIWYAQHIHSIYLHTTLHIDHSVFHYLSNAHLGSPLMPQLRKLYVAPGFPLCRGMASLLSGPALRMLNCGTDYQSYPSPPHGHPGVPRTLLADFVTCSPGVESLVVGECADFSLILMPIGALRGLRKLDVSRACFPFGIEFLRALDHLDQLEHLLLSDTFHASAAPPCGGLKGVKKLTILGGASTVPALLASLPYMRLRELCISSITFRAVIDGETRLSMSSLSFDDVGMLAAALSEGPGKNLEKLSLEDSVAGQALLHEPVSTLLAPFFALQGIRHFKLSSSQALVITNEDLQKIGRAWPKLEHLCLTYTGYGAAPTMGGIVELANVCPRLASLSLSTVIPVVAEGDVVPPLKAYDVSKFSFEVWIPDQRIRDVGQLARVLCSAFGRLQIGKLDRGHFRKWSAVLDLMEAYIEETERWYGIQIPQ